MLLIDMLCLKKDYQILIRPMASGIIITSKTLKINSKITSKTKGLLYKKSSSRMNCFLINQNIKTTTWRETLLTLPKNDLCRKYTKKYLKNVFKI
jgi:hypothetical protein